MAGPQTGLGWGGGVFRAGHSLCILHIYLYLHISFTMYTTYLSLPSYLIHYEYYITISTFISHSLYYITISTIISHSLYYITMSTFISHSLYYVYMYLYLHISFTMYTTEISLPLYSIPCTLPFLHPSHGSRIVWIEYWPGKTATFESWCNIS